MGCFRSSALGVVGRKSACGANLFSPPKQWVNDMYRPIWRVVDGKAGRGARRVGSGFVSLMLLLR